MPTSMPSWYRPVWFCLSGDQPLPNVLPALRYQPREVVLFHTSMKNSRDSAHRCKRFLNHKGIATRTVQTDAFDSNQVQQAINKQAAQVGWENVLINWTGGTKVMALAAVAAAPKSTTTLYYDTRIGLLINLSLPYMDLPPGPYPEMYDQIRLNANISDVRWKDRLLGKYSTEWLVENADSRLCASLARYRADNIIKLKQKKKWKNMPVKGLEALPWPDLASAMKKDDMLVDSSPFRPNVSGLDFLQGFWFESYVTKRLMHGFKELSIINDVEIHQNVEITWHSQSKRAVENEIDIAFLYNDRLHLVSCTTASESEVNKRHQAVEKFAEHLGGRFATAMMACTQPPPIINNIRSRQSPRTSIPYFKEWRRPAILLKKWLNIN